MEEAPASNASNVTVLDESIDDVGQSTSRFLQKHPFYFTVPLVATVICEVTFIVARVPSLGVYIFPLFFPILGYGFARSKVQHEFMQQFAAANGFSYSAGGWPEGLDGSLFKIGHSQSAVDIVSGQFQNDPITLFTYTYVTGYGKSQQTHNYTIFKLQFDITLPDMLLENGGHSFGESLFDKITGSGKELIKLEGDFNKYFSLSIPKGYEVEALEIFTPDIMAELIDKAKNYSLEIVNSHLFIYDSGIVSTRQGLYNLYDLAQYFVEKLGPVLARMKPVTAAMEGAMAQVSN